MLEWFSQGPHLNHIVNQDTTFSWCSDKKVEIKSKPAEILTQLLTVCIHVRNHVIVHLLVGNFVFYMMQLKGAEALGKPARELAVIHVSLAATYIDLAQHSKAVEHYRQELALRQGSSTEVIIALFMHQ